MAAMYYMVVCRDNTADNAPVKGLRPAWAFLKRLSDGKDVTPPPVSEIGGGQYRVGPIDLEAIGGDVTGQLDMGASVKSPGDRWIDVEFCLSDQRGVYNLDAPVSGAGQSVAKVVTVGAIQMGVISAASFAKGTIPTLLGGANLKLVSQ